MQNCRASFLQRIFWAKNKKSFQLAFAKHLQRTLKVLNDCNGVVEEYLSC